MEAYLTRSSGQCLSQPQLVTPKTLDSNVRVSHVTWTANADSLSVAELRTANLDCPKIPTVINADIGDACLLESDSYFHVSTTSCTLIWDSRHNSDSIAFRFTHRMLRPEGIIIR